LLTDRRNVGSTKRTQESTTEKQDKENGAEWDGGKVKQGFGFDIELTMDAILLETG
jgi:hypothetical protein